MPVFIGPPRARVASAIAAVGAALGWQLFFVCGRICHARSLLQALGSSVEIRLDVRRDAWGGLGVHVREAVHANTTLLTVPRSLWLTSAGCPSNDGTVDCPGFTHGSRLLLTLSRERQRPSSPHMAAYLNSLPAACPRNLAARPVADRRFVTASARYGWLAAALQEEELLLRSELPETGEADRQLLMCLKMSRAFSDLSEPPPAAAVHPSFGYCRAAMIPLFDLMNHGNEPTVRATWSAEDGVVLIATRDLSAGTELVHSYGAGAASAARLLLSYGIAAPDAPAAVIDIDGMPPAADRALMWQQRCGAQAEGTGHLLLRAAAAGARAPDNGDDERALRDGLRCLRLRLYSRPAALWALESGYVERTWLRADARPPPMDEPAEEAAQRYAECVRTDAHLVFAARRYCEHEVAWGLTSVIAKADHGDAATDDSAVSDDIREALAAEEVALRTCVGMASMVLHALVALDVPGVADIVRGLEEAT